MRHLIRFASAFAIAAALTAAPGCSSGPPSTLPPFGEGHDPGIVSEVSLEEATQVAKVALEGVNQRSYAMWSTRWDQSMLDGVKESAWLASLGPFGEKFGKYRALRGAAKTPASDPRNVRFNFLAEFERAELMVVHVYPKDGDKIIGVHIRQSNGQPLQ